MLAPVLGREHTKRSWTSMQRGIPAVRLNFFGVCGPTASSAFGRSSMVFEIWLANTGLEPAARPLRSAPRLSPKR